MKPLLFTYGEKTILAKFIGQPIQTAAKVPDLMGVSPEQPNRVVSRRV